MGNAGSDLKSKSNAEIDEIFTKFDKDGSGAISSGELQVALSELFNVQMSSSQRGALMAAADTNPDGILQKSEFVDFAKTYEGSLPGSLHFGEPGIQFVSFSTDVSIGLTLSTNEGTKMPRVDATEGPAAEAGVPIGSSIKYLHDQVRTKRRRKKDEEEPARAEEEDPFFPPRRVANRERLPCC